jgi:DNA-binding CsgD family transcriptional regulator
LDAYHTRAIERGDFHDAVPALQQSSDIAWFDGDWTDALSRAKSAEEGARIGCDDTALAFTLGSRTWVEAHLGNVEATRSAAAEGLELIERTSTRQPEPRLRGALAALALSRADPREAVDQLSAITKTARGNGFAVRAAVHAADEIEALAALGETALALEVQGHLRATAARSGNPSLLAAADRTEGVLAAAQGDLDAAQSLLEAALSAQRRLGSDYEQARTLLVLGVVHRRARRRLQARNALDEARLLFGKLGARLWAERATSELESVRGRTATPQTLTERERRIAELVASGHANKAVAAELFLSVKTVEAALSRIYRKLDVSSRTQLAARLGPGDHPQM